MQLYTQILCKKILNFIDWLVRANSIKCVNMKPENFNRMIIFNGMIIWVLYKYGQSMWSESLEKVFLQKKYTFCTVKPIRNFINVKKSFHSYEIVHLKGIPFSLHAGVIDFWHFSRISFDYP